MAALFKAAGGGSSHLQWPGARPASPTGGGGAVDNDRPALRGPSMLEALRVGFLVQKRRLSPNVIFQLKLSKQNKRSLWAGN